jgi:hypothetical protein
MRYNTALAFYKRPIAIATVLGITTAAVAVWKRKGVVPRKRAEQLQLLSGGNLKVDESVYATDGGQSGV